MTKPVRSIMLAIFIAATAAPAFPRAPGGSNPSPKSSVAMPHMPGAIQAILRFLRLS